MSQFSTAQIAKRVGIHRVTLERWLSSGKVQSPKTVRIGDGTFRQWTTVDLERVRKYKQDNYRKGRGRKPKPKR